MHIPELLRPPGIPEIVEGFLRLGRNAIPVIRLDRAFQLSETVISLYTPVIVLRPRAGGFAVLADSIVNVATIQDTLPAAPEDSFNGCVAATATVDGQTLSILEPSKILLEKERRIIEDFERREAERLARADAAMAGAPS